jgi:hypothetical protein
MEDIVDTKELTEQLRDVLDSVPEFPPCGYIPISSNTLACWVSTFSTDVRRPRIRFLEWQQRRNVLMLVMMMLVMMVGGDG